MRFRLSDEERAMLQQWLPKDSPLGIALSKHDKLRSQQDRLLREIDKISSTFNEPSYPARLKRLWAKVEAFDEECRSTDHFSEEGAYVIAYATCWLEAAQNDSPAADQSS